MKQMKNWLIFLIFTISYNAWSDCRGCCSGHQGAICSNNITQCGDGTSLSNKCEARGCNKCLAKPAPEKKINTYNREAFPHWIDADSDCQNTRAEILIETSLVGPAFKTKRKCIVVTGKWIDPYSGKTFTNANDLDIDHVIPLKAAFISGADQWDTSKREKFANDPNNLIPVWKRLNRQKGFKGPDEWLPPNQKFQCDYYKKWKKLKEEYGLTWPAREIASVKEKLKDCNLDGAR